jgi:FkbM family methyltransferase
LVQALGSHGVNVVLDVGANTGQFAKALRASGFADRIISFEPLKDPHAELSALARHDRLWEIAPRVAIGDRAGTVNINVSRNRLSSSILPMCDAHVQAEPSSSYVATESVPVATLDDVAAERLGATDVPFVKIDVQGYEGAVLDGATAFLSRVVGVQMELSLLPLYQGQDLWLAMIERLGRLGFEPWSLVPGFVDPRNGRLLQCDIVAFRSTANGSPLKPA